jgi:AraC-like DNA-binding protein
VQRVVSGSTLLVAAPLARRELGWLVNSAVLACYPNSTLDADSASYAGDTPQRLRRALEFTDEHAGEPISLNEIAAAAQLSPRGLQAAFRRHLDTTPLVHLRSVRMERARRDLENAEPGDGSSVAAVAARWGSPTLDVSLLSTVGDSASTPVRRYAANAFPSSGIQLAASPSKLAVSPRHRSWFGCRGRLAAAC